MTSRKLNGNRTRYHRNLGLGQASAYGRNEDLSNTFNNVNQMTAISDADAATYAATSRVRRGLVMLATLVAPGSQG